MNQWNTGVDDITYYSKIRSSLSDHTSTMYSTARRCFTHSFRRQEAGELLYMTCIRRVWKALQGPVCPSIKSESAQALDGMALADIADVEYKLTPCSLRRMNVSASIWKATGFCS